MNWETLGSAVVGGVIALAAVAWKARIDRGARIEAESKEERYSVYRRLISMLQGTLGDESKKQLAVDIILFGSDEMTKQWITFLDAVFDRKVANDTPEAAELWAGMLLAMRKDTSRPGTKLAPSDLLAALGIRKGRDPLAARELSVRAGLAKSSSKGASNETHGTNSGD